MSKSIAMQFRCIYCLKEQYAVLVAAISRGRCPCAWCGKTPPVLTDEEYSDRLRTAFAARADAAARGENE